MVSVRLFQAVDVVAMTGLSRSQLREWTGRDRRQLIPPDVEPQGPGRHALYTWQTAVALRLLRALQDEFAAEVGAWAPGVIKFRQRLEGAAFPSLWGAFVHFSTPSDPELIIRLTGSVPRAGLTLALDPHLEAVATRLSYPRPDQLVLFPAVAVTR